MRPRSRPVLALILLLGGLSATPANAKGWLPDCWRRFWDGEAPVTAQVSRQPPAMETPTTELTVDPPVSDSWFRCDRWHRCLRRWAMGRPQPDYGLSPLPDTTRAAKPQKLVVYLHGLNSRPEDLQGLVAEATQQGLACATFRYPNDQPIAHSAEQLAADLRDLQRANPDLSVTLVAHSMGGLVARAAVEDPQLDPSNVRRLIMIATPNQGSYLAHYACSLDLWEYVSSGRRRRESGILAGSIQDGLSEATVDLQPGSPFLCQLNQRPRNPRVRYSLVIGTAGPLPPEDMASVEGLLSRGGRFCRWLASAERLYRDRVLVAEELFTGQGDGLVAVRRAHLSGVDDVVLGEFSHGGILEPQGDAEVRRVRREILARL